LVIPLPWTICPLPSCGSPFCRYWVIDILALPSPPCRLTCWSAQDTSTRFDGMLTVLISEKLLPPISSAQISSYQNFIATVPSLAPDCPRPVGEGEDAGQTAKDAVAGVKLPNLSKEA